MSISEHLSEIRQLIGHRLLLLPAVAAVVRNDEGAVLFMRAAVDGRWGLPAGAIEPGETPGDAVVREVHEETGLTVEPVRLIGVFGGLPFREVYPNGDEVEYTAVVLECRVRSGNLRPVDGEALELEWFAIADAPPLSPRFPPDLLLT